MKRGIVVVDLQNEYLPTGKLPLTGIDTVVENAIRVLSHARQRGCPIFHIRHESAEEAPFFSLGSSGAEIQLDVAPQGDEPIIVKHHINAFRQTNLKQQLDSAGVEQIVVIGAMSHMCIDAVVRAAVDMGYPTTVLHDACATLDLTFDGVSVPAAHAHAVIMAALEFGYASVDSVEKYLTS